ncbi:HAD-IC family P-type ATPase [Candidatus Woesearchaeota archaeon]|nr:HAD-IC family P-type ATPase [Candidatus Woesearchaeota archaeon]
MDEHKIPLKTLYKNIEGSEDGLTTEEATRRLEKAGPNELKVKKDVPEIVKFFRQFKNFFALLLLVGASLAFLAEYLDPGHGNIYIGLALIVVVLLNGLFTYLQEHQSERIMESFRDMLPSTITVLRDGKQRRIETRLLVPGDIIILEEGDKIPADGRLIEIHNLKVDHSSLTGESEPQLRKLECTNPDLLESRNMIFSGTLVQSGNGKAIVYATGMHTQIGKLVKLTKETDNVQTPIRKELNHFIRIISSIALFLGFVFFIVSIILGKQMLGSLIFAIGIIVANVPEGLLPTVTLALSMASRRMAKKNALIKNLESVETLGSTTVICTDKTGTITQNKMKVTSLFLNGEQHEIHEQSVEKMSGLSVLWAAMALCNNARLTEKGYEGDPTEGALLVYANTLKPLKKLVKEMMRVHETPFDSDTKRMITTHDAGKQNIAYMKGAPEVVLEKSHTILLKGKEVELTTRRRKELKEAYKRLAARGERVLAFAYKHTKKEKVDEKGFVLVGLVGMLDPPRPEISDAIAKCRTAGIRVFMVTGDYSVTAEAIARQVGLFTGDGKVVKGSHLERMSDEELSQLLKEQEIVFARTSPIQKLRIVKALQKRGEVVTVTGDGVNDAPALKNGDMGVAMGLSGTDVAKEASDMVLLDDNFATIVNAVEEGRTIFANIKKFIAYILTSNIPQILPFIAFVALGWPLALTVVLILSIDLGTDLLPALGLGSEKPEQDVMKQKPRKRSERLLTPQLLGISYGIVGMMQAAAGFVAFFVVLFHNGWTWGQELAFSNPLYMEAVAAFFAAVVICQVADVMICRTRRQSLFSVGFFSNRLVNFGILAELALLAVIVYVPFLHPFFGTQSLAGWELLLGVPFALLILAYDETRKLLARNGNKFVNKYLTW